jgi:hypothetical protein
VVPLTVTGTNGGAFYGAFATLPAGQPGAVTYDTTSNKLKWYDAQAAQWKNAQSGWIEGEITETGGALAVTGTVTSTKLGPPNIYFGSGDIPDNSSTSFPASPTHSVTFTKTATHTTLLCTITGSDAFGGGRNTGSTRTDYLDIGIFVDGTLKRSIPLMTRGVAGNDSLVFLAFYAPIDGIAAGTVTVDMRIRKGNSGSGTVYLTGAVLQVIEL